MSCCNDATLDNSLQTMSHLDDDTLMLSGMKDNLRELAIFVVIQQKAKWPRYMKCKYANYI